MTALQDYGEPKCLKAHCKCMYGEAGGCPNHHYSQCNTASPVEGSGDGVEAILTAFEWYVMALRTEGKLTKAEATAAIELLLLEAKAEAELGLIADCNRWRNIPGGIEQVLDDREAELQSNLKKGQE